MVMWKEVLEKIRCQIPKPSFDTWFKKTSIEVGEGVLTIYASNGFMIDWIERQYSELIVNTVKEVTGKDYDLQFVEVDFESLPQNSRSESFHYDSDNINRLEKKIDKLEEKVQQLIDVKRLDERAERLEERVIRLEQQIEKVSLL